MLKKEKELLTELLESGLYERPEDLAVALYELSVSLWMSHPRWGVHIPGRGAFGPAESKAQAKKVAKQWNLSDEYVRELRPFPELRVDTTPGDVSRSCPVCGHPKFAHGFSLNSGRCIVGWVFKNTNTKPDLSGCCNCEESFRG